LTAPPALRINSVQNAASLLDDPIAPGETITIRGAGFQPDVQLLIGGQAVSAITASSNSITAVAPATLPDGAVTVQVKSGGATSNTVLAPVVAAAPGLFSVDRTGVGQGYILNADGSPNSPSNPAKDGDRITIFVTGAGPVSFDHGYAVTANPVSTYIYGLYMNGVSAVQGPVDGFPGDVYRLTVIIPSVAEIRKNFPDIQIFSYPPQVGITLTIAGRSSQSGLAVSIAQ
jgi:uncharacterized protein (TIGR03437 family)